MKVSTGPAGWQLMASDSLCNRYRGKSIHQVSSYLPSTREEGDFLQQRNHGWKSSYDESQHTLEFILNCFHPLRSTYLHRPNKQVESGCIGSHHHCMTQVSASGINLRNVLLLLDYNMVGRRSSKAFPLAFPIIIALTPWIKKPLWGFCQLLSTPVPRIHYRSGKITRGWLWEATGPTVR